MEAGVREALKVTRARTKDTSGGDGGARGNSGRRLPAARGGLPPSRRTKQRGTRGPGSAPALGARPAPAPSPAGPGGAHDSWKWRLGRRRGCGERASPCSLCSGHPGCETGAGRAFLGRHLSRSIRDSQLRGWESSVAGPAEQRRVPRRASGQPEERSLRWRPPRRRVGGARVASVAGLGGAVEATGTHGCRPGAPRDGEKGNVGRGARGRKVCRRRPGFLDLSPGPRAARSSSHLVLISRIYLNC